MKNVKPMKGFSLVLIVVLLIGIGGCITSNTQNTPDASDKDNLPSSVPNTQQPSFMVDDVLYYSTGLKVSISVAESDYLGKITSVVSITEKPTKNGQANIPYEDAPYVKYQDGLALLMDKDWIYFKVWENI